MPYLSESSDQLIAARARQRDPAGVLEVRQDVHELRSRSAAPLPCCRSAEPMVIGRHGDVLGAHQVERLQRAQIRWTLDQDAIAAIDEQLGDQVQRLLRPRGDQHVIDAGHDSVARHVPDDVLAQRTIAFGRPVLQRRGGLRLQHAMTRLLETRHRKQLRRGQAAGEGNHLRPLRELQEFADDGTFCGLGALRVAMGPRRCHTTPPLPIDVRPPKAQMSVTQRT